MAVPQAQAVEVDALLSSGKLSVDGDHSWTQSDKRSWYKLRMPVRCEGTKPVALRIAYSVSSFNRAQKTLVLLWNNNIRVRALCLNGSHGNRHTNDEEWVRRTHKHKWTDPCQDRFAYTPTDITETTVQGLLEQFCAECGIRCFAKVAELPRQEINYDDL